MTIDFVPASSLSVGELAGLFTAAYEDYLVPVAIDESSLRFMIRTFDHDREASRVALRDGELVGLANLAVRGDRGWIGGIGVVKAARRQGLGELLMHTVLDEARSRGLREVALEVIDGNDAAIALYAKPGFETTRLVEVWSLEQGPDGDGRARQVPVEEARARISALRRAPEPWQRADETVDRYDDLDALAAEGGATVFRVADERVVLLQIAGDEESAHTLLSALRTRGDVHVLNLPENDPAAPAFRRLGGRVTLRQHEMVLRL